MAQRAGAETAGGDHPEARRDLRDLVAGLVDLGRNGDREPADTHLREYVRILRKRMGLLVGVALAVVAAVGVKTFLERPVYRASTRVLIEREKPRPIEGIQYVPYEWDTAEFFETQIQIIRSRPVAQRAMDALGLLAKRPELAQAKDPAGAFLGAVSVGVVKNTRLLEVAVEDPDPATAAEAANALAQAYINRSLERRVASARETLTWLGNHVTDLKQKVNESELALQRYKNEAGLVSSEEKQSLAVKKLADFNSAYIEAQARRLELETTLGELRAKRDLLESSPLVQNNAVIQKLKASLVDLDLQRARLLKTYRERHPDVVRVQGQIAEVQQRIDEEVGRLVQVMESDVKVQRAREAAMLAAVNQYRAEVQDVARKEIQSGILKREADTNQQLYELLLKRLKEASLSENLEAGRIEIVEPALVPTRPARPQIVRNLLLAVVGGLAAALALAFFVEYMDDTVRTPDQLERAAGLPVFALVPRIVLPGRTGKRLPPPLVALEAPSSLGGEAYRVLRTNLRYARPDAPPRVVLVTSAGAGEGKSTTVANLGVALAQAEHSVLLVDADLRKPALHAVFQQERTPGLSNVLAGEATLDSVIVPTPVPRLSLLPAGAIPPNAAELLGSRRMSELLAAVRGRFDLVLLDSPPVLAVSDAYGVAPMVDGVLLVARSGALPGSEIRRAVEQVEAVQGRLIGTLLNHFEPRAVGYSRRYYGRYDSYYHADTGRPGKRGARSTVPGEPTGSAA
jgi:succinoglycan biosynthesis transport protein ExoP